MAQPIAFDIPPRDPQQELQKRLETAPAEHAEALLDAFELIQELHDHGVFQLLRGTIGATDKIIETVTDASRSDETVRAIRNALILGKMLGSIDPKALQSVATAVSETSAGFEKPANEPSGILSLLGQFRGKDLRRSVALINRFLRNLGKQIE